MQMKDFTLARQEVVLNVQPVHRLEMPAQDGNRHQVAYSGRFIVPLFNCVQCLLASGKILLVLLVPL